MKMGGGRGERLWLLSVFAGFGNCPSLRMDRWAWVPIEPEHSIVWVGFPSEGRISLDGWQKTGGHLRPVAVWMGEASFGFFFLCPDATCVGLGGDGISSFAAADDGSIVACLYFDETEEERFLLLSQGEWSRFFPSHRSARSRSSCFWMDARVFVCSRSCLTSLISSCFLYNWTKLSVDSERIETVEMSTMIGRALEIASGLEFEIGVVWAGAVSAF